MEKEYDTVGTHIVCDLWGVDFDLLNDEIMATHKMVTYAILSGAKVLEVSCKKFEPNGYTILLTLAESHFSIHTYPEKGFAALDCYTCGDTVVPRIAIDGMINYLTPVEVSLKELSRGSKSGIEVIVP